MNSAESSHEAEVIRALHKIPNKDHSLWMYYAKCSCGEMSPWLLEAKYASLWIDKHAILVKNGVLNPLKSLVNPRVDTVYKQYRVLQDDERYSDADRAIFRQMADELEGRTKPDGPDPNQMELF